MKHRVRDWIHRIKETQPFPKPKRFWLMLGPSFLILATGLGTGEVVLWPFLASQYGMGLAWLAVIGITFQYFINMEIERYTLVKGESVFMGLHRLFRYAPHWLMFSTFLSFAIPGTAAASAQLIAHLTGLDNFKWLAVALIVLMGVILSVGKTVYGVLERLMKITIAVLVPAVIIFLVYVTDTTDWIALGEGLVGQGEGYSWIPPAASIAAIFGAFAYSGSGGNLNLTQSEYVKEAGYGMGKYSQRVQGLLHKGSIPKIKLHGVHFENTKENLDRFKIWWRRISWEHFIVFWGVGLLMILLLMLLAHSTIFGMPESQGIGFIIEQGNVLGGTFAPILGVLFLAGMGIILFQSQLGIYDSSVRIIAENFAIKKMDHTNESRIDVSKIYHIVLWAQVVLGVVLFSLGYTDPKSLIILAAILNAIGMFVHVGLVNWMNHKVLRKEVQAPMWRKILMVVIFVVFGVFSIITVIEHIPAIF